MISQIIFALVSLALAFIIFRLLRSGRLREKYSALWIIIGTGIIVLALWPGLLGWLAVAVGIALPVNLLFFFANLLLLGVALHLSLEVSRLEDETRVLAERVALLDLDLERLKRGIKKVETLPESAHDPLIE